MKLKKRSIFYVLGCLFLLITFAPLSSATNNLTKNIELEHVEIITDQELETELPSTDFRIIRPNAQGVGSNAIVGHCNVNCGINSSGVSNILNQINNSTGNVRGPSSSTVDAVALFADTTGKLLKNSSVLVDASGNVTLNGITKNGNTSNWPSTSGAAGTFLGSDGAGNLIFTTPVGGGNVSTALPFTSANAIIRTDIFSGFENIQQSIVTLDNSGNIAGVNTLTANAINANVNGNALNFTGTLAGDVSGNQYSTVVNSVGGQSAASIASGVIAANLATDANTPNTIVKRDASGNFNAGIITANLTGDVTGNLFGNATSATTAGSSTNFTGTLAGDVSGNQYATVVNSVGGQSAASIASGVIAANLATNANTPNTIVKRDASGNFNAGTITANLTGDVTGNLFGNATSATTAGSATNFTGPLTGDVTGNQNSTLVVNVGGQSASDVANATASANAATSNNIFGTIVKRDASGNFSAGTITANLTGNVTGNLIGNVTGNVTGNASSATTAQTALNFTGTLAGDVTGNQFNTSVQTVGGQTAANIASATTTVLSATSNDQPNTLVLRDGSGNFATNKITIDGSIVNPNDAATKAYVDSIASLGLSPKTPAVVVSTTDVVLTGLQTIDGVILVDSDRVLLVAQTNPVENGLWVAHAGAWTRPADFASGTAAGQAYVLITEGAVNAGSSWICTTTAAIIDTDPIQFVEFSLPDTTTGANVGTGAGMIFRDKTGVTLNFKTISNGSHIIVTNNANDVNIATDGTSANTPNTLVSRDGSGNFSANTITAALTGSASLNVLKAGDTMTGNLNMALQSAVNFQDGSGSGNFVGINAPAIVATSYNVNLPPSAPTVGQVLQASSPTALEWATIGGTPAVAQTFYVSKAGNDSNDGSFGSPFATVSHALTAANAISSASNPIAISIGAGIFTENNSGGPLNIIADGISIIGSSINDTVIEPQDLTQNLFNCTTPSFEISSLTLDGLGSSADAFALSSNAFGVSRFINIAVQRFNVGFNLSSGNGLPIILFQDVQPRGNITSITANNIRLIVSGGIFLGPFSGSSPANTGLSITGTNALVTILSNSFRLFNKGIIVDNGASARVLGSNFESTTTCVQNSGDCNTAIIGCSFIINNSGSINVSASGAGTEVNINGCNFDCDDATETPQGTAILATTGAAIDINSSSIEDAVIAIQSGAIGDSSATIVRANSVTLKDCITDIEQISNSTLEFFNGSFDVTKVLISNPLNVKLAAIDIISNDLAIGTGADITQVIYKVLNGEATSPTLVYQPNYYGNKGTIYTNQNADPTFNGVQANSNHSYLYAITGDNTKEAGINLLSDTANIGAPDNTRGWGITKVGTSANLAFTYTNLDTSGQAARGSNSVMQLNGFDNQVEFPLATNPPLPTNTAAKLVWAGDTDLYRLSANSLKTDGNFSVGALNTVGVVHNDASGLLSTSLIVNADVSASAGITDNKLATISTPGKVANSATTATSANTPNTIVLRDASGNFSAGTINGNITGNALNFTGTLSGDVTGNQYSTVVNSVGGQTAASIAAATTTVNAATSANTPNTLVKRDASGNFVAGIIAASLIGTVTAPAGSIASPSIQFSGGNNTGISMATTNILSLITNGLERLRIDAAGNTTYKSNYKMYAFRSTPQSISNTTATIVFNTETLDPNANYNTATGVYTVPFTGVYLISVTVTTETSSIIFPTSITINIVRNGTPAPGTSATLNLNNNNAAAGLQTTALLSLTTGDLIRIEYTTDRSDTIQPNSTHLAIHFMSF